MMNNFSPKDTQQIQEIRRKLRNIAKQNNKNYQILNLNFLFERFLYRLSISKHCDNFVLKGGLLLKFHNLDLRGTRDIDLSILKISFNKEFLMEIIKDIANINCDDGVIFDLDSISSVETGVGFKFYLRCYLGVKNYLLHIDISEGYENKEVPDNIEFIEYPVIFSDKIPKIWVDTLEVLIADKFEGMISRTIHNTRMKDFYDIFYITEKEQIDGEKLRKCIIYIFKKKERIDRITKKHIYFSKEIISNNQLVSYWTSFKEKNPNIMEKFDIIMKRNQVFFEPVFNSIIKGEEFPFMWNPQELNWISN